MATLDDVRRIAEALPEVTSKMSWGMEMWRVRGKSFVWERPLGTKDIADLKAAGVPVPDGEIAGARVESELAKSELIDAEGEVFFTVPHFDGYPVILIRLEAIAVDELSEVITDAWLLRAPKRLARTFLDDEGRSTDHTTP